MMNTFDKLVPLLTNLGSDRRSPTAGPSDIVSPNPIARVPDSAPQSPVVAPQGQDVAPNPSSAFSEPRASTSGLSSGARTISPPHMVSRSRETGPEGVAMPPLRCSIA